MAQAKRAVAFRNAVIDMKDKTITEYIKDDTNVYKLEDVLADWDGVEGISLTIQQAHEIPGIDEDEDEE